MIPEIRNVYEAFAQGKTSLYCWETWTLRVPVWLEQIAERLVSDI